jgi:hypothetical protein
MESFKPPLMGRAVPEPALAIIIAAAERAIRYFLI